MKVTSVAIVLLASLAPAHGGFSAYWKQMTSGGDAAVKPSSFAPGSWAPTSDSVNYLDNAGPGSLAPPPPAEEPETHANGAPSFASYLESMGGGSAAPVKPASYAPGGGRSFAPTGGSGMASYLDNVAPATNGYAAAPVQPAAPYLNQMGGVSAAPVKPASYAPGGGKPYAPTGGSGMTSYLDNVAPVANGYEAALAAPSSASYLEQMGGGSAPVKKASYAPGGGKPYAPTGGSGMTSYLDNVAPAANGYQAATNAAPTSAAYLEQMGGGTAPAKAASYGFGSGKIFAATGGTGIGSYLENFGVSAEAMAEKPTFVPTADAEPSSNNAVLEAIARMNNDMNNNQHATIEVLKDISSGVKSLVSKAEARVAASTGATSGMWQ